MKWLEASVDRPLPVFLGAILVVLLGFWCLSELPVNRTPKIEIPYAVVSDEDVAQRAAVPVGPARAKP